MLKYVGGCNDPTTDTPIHQVVSCFKQSLKQVESQEQEQE